MTLEEKYQQLCATPSDIYMHLPKLREYAEKFNHVTEMGFRHGEVYRTDVNHGLLILERV